MFREARTAESPGFFGPMGSAGEAEAFAQGFMCGDPSQEAWALEVEEGSARVGAVVGGQLGVNFDGRF